MQFQFTFTHDIVMMLTQYIQNDKPISLVQVYHAPNRSDCYKHQILNISSQSQKSMKKSLMTQCLTVLRHQYTFHI